jgi:hypothetical protein
VPDRSGDAPEALRSVALGPHAHLDELLSSVSAAHPSNAEPRRVRELADTFMAITSRHLSAVDHVLLPVARKRLADGHETNTAYLTQARELEQAIHAVKATLYGDVNARHLHADSLWNEVRRLLRDHENLEAELVQGLVSTLADDELTNIADRLRRTEEQAPTRPHPYTPHTGPLGRLVSRIWSVVDSFWDNAENRIIPHRVRPPHPRRDSLLTRYVMGAPRFDQSEQKPPE